MSGTTVDMNSAWCELWALCACQYVPFPLFPPPPNLTVCAWHVKLNSSLCLVWNLIFLLSYGLTSHQSQVTLPGYRCYLWSPTQLLWTLQLTLLVSAVRRHICTHNMARLFPLNPVLQLFCFFHMAPGWACYREMQSLRLTWRSVTWGLQTGQLWLDQVLGELVHFGRKETVVFLSRALGLCWGSCTKLHYSGISPYVCFSAMAFTPTQNIHQFISH